MILISGILSLQPRTWEERVSEEVSEEVGEGGGGYSRPHSAAFELLLNIQRIRGPKVLTEPFLEYSDHSLFHTSV